MAISQIGAVAAGVEAARFSGIQQNAQAAITSTVQRQTNRVAEEADLKKTEVVEESGQRSDVSSASNDRLVDITV